MLVWVIARPQIACQPVMHSPGPKIYFLGGGTSGRALILLNREWGAPWQDTFLDVEKTLVPENLVVIQRCLFHAMLVFLIFLEKYMDNYIFIKDVY